MSINFLDLSAEEVFRKGGYLTRHDNEIRTKSRGRRARVFYWFLSQYTSWLLDQESTAQALRESIADMRDFASLLTSDSDPRMPELLKHKYAEVLEVMHKRMVALPISNRAEVIDDTLSGAGEYGNAELPVYWQDLGDTIVQDIVEACESFDDPDVHYPGVTDGIPPVPDTHVNLVIWGMQRELNRELRRPRVDATVPSARDLGIYQSTVGNSPKGRLPAVVLSELPWRVQRALVERRRLRFQQWGITRERWEQGYVHFNDIPDDPDWTPVFKVGVA